MVSHGELSGQDHSLGNKEKRLRLGCTQIVLDLYAKWQSSTLVHSCPWKSAPDQSKRGSQSPPLPPSSRRNARPLPGLTTPEHLTRDALHLSWRPGQAVHSEKASWCKLFLSLLVSNSTCSILSSNCQNSVQPPLHKRWRSPQKGNRVILDVYQYWGHQSQFVQEKSRNQKLSILQYERKGESYIFLCVKFIHLKSNQNSQNCTMMTGSYWKYEMLYASS